MNIVSISDIHQYFPRDLPQGDVLTVSGDICFAARTDYEAQYHHIKLFIMWCETLLDDKRYKDIVFVAGNHDGVFQQMMVKNQPIREIAFRKELPAHIHYLRDSMAEIDGVKFYGTPWTTEFCSWAFNASEGELDVTHYSKIPEGVDVLLTHGPVYGKNDRLGNPYNRWGPEKLGSKALLKHCLRAKPSWVIFGHIHSGNHVPEEIVHENIVVKTVNVSIVDEQYHPHYDPFMFEINKVEGKKI
jgi:Icc-related predicted phosphoesterase